jgi:tetratricopeptide (TPR) repeat protein
MSEHEFDFDAAGKDSQAAPFRETAQLREAVLRFLEGGALDQAASLIASSGAEVGDALLDEDAPKMIPSQREALADAFFRARDFERAGRAAALLDDPERAAQFYEKSGQFVKAAALYERLHRNDKAAELHERGRNFERAGRLFEQAGILDRAAQAFERSGGLYEAGRLWARQRKLDRALQALQQVDSSHPSFVPAMLLLGRILEYTGHVDAAAARYLDVVHARPLDATTVDIHERLIDLYVAAGNEREARRFINRVISFDPSRQKAPRALGLMLGKGSSEATMRSPGGPSKSTQAPASTAVISVTAVHPIIDTLRQLPLLAELSLGELRALHALGEQCHYEQDEVLIEQGEVDRYLIVLLSGAVQVLRVDGAQETTLAELRYGACVGEMALIDQGPASARVRALRAIDAFRWPVERLRQHLAADEHTALALLRVMSRTMSIRLRETSGQARP